MGMLHRIWTIWKADLHGVMDQIEDKGLLLKQYLREMEDSLLQKESRLEHSAQTCRRIGHDLDQKQEEMQKLGLQTDRALGQSKDDIARMLIRKRKSIEAACIHLRAQLDDWSQAHRRLAELLGQQRLQYDQLRLKADAYFYREQLCRDDQAIDRCHGLDRMPSPAQEEIELELLQRKEALAGGAL